MMMVNERVNAVKKESKASEMSEASETSRANEVRANEVSDDDWIII